MAGKQTAFYVKWLDITVGQYGWKSQGILSVWKVATLHSAKT